MIFAFGMLFFLIGFLMALSASIISVIQGFKDSTKWGVLNLAGVLVLLLIPNLIFCFTDFKERSGPIWLFFGAIPVYAMGGFLLLANSYVIT